MDNKPKRKTRRAILKEETRELILDTAKNLFEKKGFAKTTIRNIAEVAGIGTGTVFSHFDGKDALLAAALYQDIENVLENSLETVPYGVSLKEQLLHIARGLYDNYSARPDLSRTFIKQMLFIGGEWGHALDLQVKRFEIMVRHLADEALERGELGRGTDPGMLASAYFSNYLYALILSFKQPEFKVDEAITILDGLLDVTLS